MAAVAAAPPGALTRGAVLLPASSATPAAATATASLATPAAAAASLAASPALTLDARRGHALAHELSASLLALATPAACRSMLRAAAARVQSLSVASAALASFFGESDAQEDERRVILQIRRLALRAWGQPAVRSGLTLWYPARLVGTDGNGNWEPDAAGVWETVAPVLALGASVGSFTLLSDLAAALLRLSVDPESGALVMIPSRVRRSVVGGLRHLMGVMLRRLPANAEDGDGIDRPVLALDLSHVDTALEAAVAILTMLVRIARLAQRRLAGSAAGGQSNPPPPLTSGRSWYGTGTVFLPDGSVTAADSLLAVARALQGVLSTALVGVRSAGSPRRWRAANGAMATHLLCDLSLAALLIARPTMRRDPSVGETLSLLGTELDLRRDELTELTIALTPDAVRVEGAASATPTTSSTSSAAPASSRPSVAVSTEQGDEDLSVAEAGSATSRAAWSASQASLSILATAGSRLSAREFAGALYESIAAIPPGVPIPSTISELLRQLPDALASTPDDLVPPTLCDITNLLSFIAFRSLTGPTNNFRVETLVTPTSLGGRRGFVIPQWQAASPGAATSSSSSSSSTAAAAAAAAAPTTSALSASSMLMDMSDRSMASADFRSAAMDLWQQLLTRDDVASRADPMSAAYAVSQVLYHLRLVLEFLRSSSDSAASSSASSSASASPSSAVTLDAAARSAVLRIAERAIERIRAVLLFSPEADIRDAVATSPQLEYCIVVCLEYRQANVGAVELAAFREGRWTEEAAAVADLNLQALDLLQDVVFRSFSQWTRTPTVPVVRRAWPLRSRRLLQALLRLVAPDAAGTLSFTRALFNHRDGRPPVTELRAAQDARRSQIFTLLFAAIGGYGPALDERLTAVASRRLLPSGGGPADAERWVAKLSVGPGDDVTMANALARPRVLDLVSVGFCAGTVIAEIDPKHVIIRPVVRSAMVATHSPFETADPATAERARTAEYDRLTPMARARLSLAHTTETEGGAGRGSAGGGAGGAGGRGRRGSGAGAAGAAGAAGGVRDTGAHPSPVGLSSTGGLTRIPADFNPTFGPLRPASHTDPDLSPFAPLGDLIVTKAEAASLGVFRFPPADDPALEGFDTPELGPAGLAFREGGLAEDAWGNSEAGRANPSTGSLVSPSLWAVRHRIWRTGPMPPTREVLQSLHPNLNRLIPDPSAATFPPGSPLPVMPPLARPVGFVYCGTLENSRPRAHVWRPVPPAPYVALGSVTTVDAPPRERGPPSLPDPASLTPPPVDSVWCIHESLTDDDLFAQRLQDPIRLLRFPISPAISPAGSPAHGPSPASAATAAAGIRPGGGGGTGGGGGGGHIVALAPDAATLSAGAAAAAAAMAAATRSRTPDARVLATLDGVAMAGAGFTPDLWALSCSTRTFCAGGPVRMLRVDRPQTAAEIADPHVIAVLSVIVREGVRAIAQRENASMTASASLALRTAIETLRILRADPFFVQQWRAEVPNQTPLPVLANRADIIFFALSAPTLFRPVEVSHFNIILHEAPVDTDLHRVCAEYILSFVAAPGSVIPANLPAVAPALLRILRRFRGDSTIREAASEALAAIVASRGEHGSELALAALPLLRDAQERNPAARAPHRASLIASNVDQPKGGCCTIA